ncbi:hypothetical protein [Campylobacter gastrosuis]|uniref:hypothetical protein n=1 Tax=Campylobacter gastrosuis TaxID=2974576 RepID=UPI0025509C93|nr:hypothetical protein [Campylobacter gastrosuis]
MVFHKKACDLNDSEGCLLVAVANQKSNPKIAKRFFKKSCELGNEVACLKAK